MLELLARLADLPGWLLYPLLGGGAALENIVPPVPADTFVFLGGVLAGRGSLSLGGVIAVTWLANVASALVVYGLGHRHGRSFFERGWGRRLLHPAQLERVAAFYDRWGPPAIFLSRFLPGLRAIVPVFAGVTHQRFLPVAVPLALASLIWYGTLAWLGGVAGRELESVWRWIGATNRTLAVAAGLLIAVLLVAWWRSRESEREDDAG